MKSGILILEQVKTGKPDVISFRLVDELYTRDKALKFFHKKRRNEEKAGKTYQIEAELEIHYMPRTQAQNNLLRALERIMAFEMDGTEETYWEYHEGLIEKYAPLVSERVNPITNRKQRKRTSMMSTVEMAKVVEGAFTELSVMGIPLTSTNIANYWVEWYNWRARQGVDPFTEVARTKEEYRQAVPVCEACMKGLTTTDNYGNERYSGQIAHIVSRGSGGSDEQWNLMHLCTDCHIHLQHQQGWAYLVKQHPHIGFRVANAQVKAGKKQQVLSDPSWGFLHEDVKKLDEPESVKQVTGLFDGETVDDSDIGIF